MSESKANSSEQGKGAKPLIYVVDDEAMLLELASVILEPLGYEVQTFRDPQTALRAFTAARPRPALIITDFAMHAMDGMTLIAGCRKAEPKQKILLVSGTVGPEIFYNAPEKPDRFLAKPYQARQLGEIVKTMVTS